MLLEAAANRLRAHLLEKFADYSPSCTGLCFTFRGEGQAETAIYEYAAPQGQRVTLNSGVDLQFIILDLSGSYNEITPSRGMGTDYYRAGRLALVMYVAPEMAGAILKVEPALASITNIRMLNFEERPQNVASQYLFLGYDFAFNRPLVAFELQVTERTLREGCVTLPSAVCAGVEIINNDVLIKTVPSGGAYIYNTINITGIADTGGNYGNYTIADSL